VAQLASLLATAVSEDAAPAAEAAGAGGPAGRTSPNRRALSRTSSTVSRASYMDGSAASDVRQLWATLLAFRDHVRGNSGAGSTADPAVASV